MRVHAISFVVALGLAFSASSAFAAPLSGGASGGGAIQGGSGAPGSGVGIPGSIVDNATAEGIGEDSTPDPTLAMGRYKALAAMPMADAARPFGQPTPHRHHHRTPVRNAS